MREHFPFTDYDFYAYLSSGMVLLAGLDYAFTGGAIMLLRQDWSFIQIVIAVAVAYATGQIAASFSSMVLESWMAHRVLRPPVAVLLSLVALRRRERFIGRYVVSRYYEPFSDATCAKIMSNCRIALGVDASAKISADEAFQIGFAAARSSEDTRHRLDDFRNQYGFGRNLSFVGVVCALVIGARAVALNDAGILWWSAAFSTLAIGMFARFMKFYCAYAAEVLRSIAFNSGR